MLALLNALRPVLKAVATAVVALAAYLGGIVSVKATGLSGFETVTTTQWLGAVVVVGGAFHVTYLVPNLPKLRRRTEAPAETTAQEPQEPAA